LNSFYRFAADLVLYLHVTFVAFVIGGLVLIFVGRYAGWSWIRNGWFRLVHLIAIAIVVLQAWLGMICPLTTLEMWLRTEAGDAVYPGAFVAHWVQRILYYDAPAWVFALLYTAFGALVVASWIWIRPRPIRTGKGEQDGNIPQD
jgi:hypothetical protein